MSACATQSVDCLSFDQIDGDCTPGYRRVGAPPLATIGHSSPIDEQGRKKTLEVQVANLTSLSIMPPLSPRVSEAVTLSLDLHYFYYPPSLLFD